MQKYILSALPTFIHFRIHILDPQWFNQQRIYCNSGDINNSEKVPFVEMATEGLVAIPRLLCSSLCPVPSQFQREGQISPLFQWCCPMWSQNWRSLGVKVTTRQNIVASQSLFGGSSKCLKPSLLLPEKPLMFFLLLPSLALQLPRGGNIWYQFGVMSGASIRILLLVQEVWRIEVLLC